MKKEKEIPLKNYILLSIVLILTIVVVINLFLWKNTYEKNKLQTPILDDYLLVINYNELNNYLVENKDAIIYVSKLNDESIRLFENKFKNIINKNNLNNKILYLNLTEELKENNIVKEINKKYGKEMTEVPTIVIIKDGKISSSYNIKENNYNIKLLEKYLGKEDLIEPLGFVLDEKRIKRSGVNYIDKVHYQRYIDFDDFKNKNKGEYYYFTRYGTKAYSEIDFSDKNKNYYLIFGKESTGIPKEILHNNLDKCYRIPTSENIRALNLSNCVALITYEALRQQNFPNLLRSDPFKGEDYLKKEDGLNQ